MLGKHVIADMYGIPFETLDNQELLSNTVVAAVKASGATVLGHHFEPQGCSGIILVAESHCSWHTWPEHGVLTLDYFTCGEVDPEGAVQEIVEALQPSLVEHQILLRAKSVDAQEAA